MSQAQKGAPRNADVRVVGPTVYCSGEWTALRLDGVEARLVQYEWPQGIIDFEVAQVSAFDTAGVWVLQKTLDALQQAGRRTRVAGMSPEARALLELVKRHQEKPRGISRVRRLSVLEKIGRGTIRHLQQLLNFLAFTGEAAVVARPLLAKPMRIRWRTVVMELGEAGHKALGIVGLLLFLIGVVIAYQGGVQLRQYGASIYIADLVGLSVVRELAPMITAIIVAGRTGSAYTAQIGTMKITEELDALRTLGITPVELLVLPKMVALIVALPLLTVYADIVGILGGMVIAHDMLEVGYSSFIDRISQIDLTSYLIGVGKAPVFAAIIAAVGCFQGFQVNGSAESVGRHTTLSVVQSIFLVIVVDAIFSVIFSAMGI